MRCCMLGLVVHLKEGSNLIMFSCLSLLGWLMGKPSIYTCNLVLIYDIAGPLQLLPRSAGKAVQLKAARMRIGFYL
jgi:hypothetical protein